MIIVTKPGWRRSSCSTQLNGDRRDDVELPLTALGDNDELAAMYRRLTKSPSYQADFMRTLAPNVEDLAQRLQRRDGI